MIYSTHPSLSKRLLAIERGYNKAILIKNDENALRNKSENNKTPKEMWEEVIGRSISDGEWCFRKLQGVLKTKYDEDISKYDYDFVINECSKCINKYPYTSSLTYLTRANIYRYNKQFSLALNDYNNSIALDENRLTLLDRAEVKVQLFDYEGAINDYYRLRVIDSSEDAYASTIADCYKKLGNNIKALENYNLSINKYKNINKDWVKTSLSYDYYNIALIYYDLENYKMALDNILKSFDYEKTSNTSLFIGNC